MTSEFEGPHGGALPNFIVIRGTSSRFDGVWMDLALIVPDINAQKADYVSESGMVTIYPTGEFESRPDGALAEVWAPAAYHGS